MVCSVTVGVSGLFSVFVAKSPVGAAKLPLQSAQEKVRWVPLAQVWRLPPWRRASSLNTKRKKYTKEKTPTRPSVEKGPGQKSEKLTVKCKW